MRKTLLASTIIIACALAIDAFAQNPGGGGQVAPANPSTAPLPPGLQKREQLPPGLQGRDQLPPGLARRTNNLNAGVGATNGLVGAATNAAGMTNLLGAATNAAGLTNQFAATNGFGLTNQFGANTNQPMDLAATQYDQRLLVSIRQKITTRLEPRLQSQGASMPVNFQVQNGVVTLVGSVQTAEIKRDIATIIRQTPGVVRVVDQLTLAQGSGLTSTNLVQPGSVPGYGWITNNYGRRTYALTNRYWNNSLEPTGRTNAGSLPAPQTNIAAPGNP